MAIALDRTVRKILERAITGKDGARRIAEDGARKALTELGLEDAKKPEGLSSAQTELRNRLRAHARSLGDVMQSDGSIRANRLVREIAYEHWHRALFARLLAENNLLIDPDHKVAVSLSDLEEIAKEEGRDPVELAADWAEPMLPQIFRKDDPVLALALPPETKAGIIEIVNGLPRAVFAADDSLGWVYQFWQADQKDRVNASEVKIGADELPAVTQLFTEDYMVLFLLENTLGAWWAGKILIADPALALGAASEEELRGKTSPPGYRWTYLRFAREPRDGETDETATGSWRPAAGVFEGWPKAAKDITVLDPCMGSGHFLVFALPILVAFRRAEEGLDERAAVNAVLADNLFGLEIDPRCTQIAAFALALASWKRLGGPEPLPRLNLACSGLAIGLGKAEFLKLAEGIADVEGWTGKADLLGTDRTPLGAKATATHRGELELLYRAFEQAPHLGSLIDPRGALERGFGPLYATGIDQLGTVLERLLSSRQATVETLEVAVTAQGLAKAARLLARTYTLIATNVPYLGRPNMDRVLVAAGDAAFGSSKADLATMLLNRSISLVARGGTVACVSPNNWLSLPRYKGFRRFILQDCSVAIFARLGVGAFDSIGGHVVNVILSIANRGSPFSTHRFFATDARDLEGATGKSEGIVRGGLVPLLQKEQIARKDHVIALAPQALGEMLSGMSNAYQGISTSDFARFGRYFWEAHSGRPGWRYFQTTNDQEEHYGGCKYVLFWEDGFGQITEVCQEGATFRGQSAWSKKGIVLNQMGTLSATIYSGEAFDGNCAVFIFHELEDIAPVFCFMQSGAYEIELRKLNQKVNVTNSILTLVPFDRAHWTRVAAGKYPNGLPKTSSNDPTQWPFDGHPRGSADPNVTADGSTNPRLVTPHGVRPGMAEHPLQVAVARLLGYRWPRQTGSSFMDCPAVPEPDEVDRSGLVDTDGIVPLPALAGEADAATRLRELLRAVWGPDYGEGTIRELLAAEEAKATDLGAWLADEFFDGHCRLFHQTPVVWHVWDGVRGGFSALVNHHRLCEENGAGRRLLEKLRDSYLGEWIAAQRRAVAAGEPGAEDRLIAAEHLRAELTKIIEGEPPYDIFVRWKPLHRFAVGWGPDIDDGVRLNIRPFLTAKPKNSGRKDGCILRVTPRVKKHAGADRGAEPHREKEDFPWFWAEDDDVATEDFAGGRAFKGRRYNDFHYTRAFKQRARDAKAAAASGTAPERTLRASGKAP